MAYVSQAEKARIQASLALLHGRDGRCEMSEPFTRREERYFNRLVERADLLRRKLETTQVRNTDDITQELHALDWAIAQLCDRLPTRKDIEETV